MKYHLLCEVGPDGSTQIFVQEFPGCYSRAPTFDEAARKVPIKIREFLDWLRKHGESIEETQYEIETEISETVNGGWPVNLGDSQALFKADLKPLNHEEVERCLRYMGYAREDFIDLYLRAPKDALEWKPDDSAPRHIRRIAEHVGEVDLFYIERLRGRRHGDWPLNLLETTEEIRELRILALSKDESNCSVSYHPPGGWTGTTNPEGWTARKVLRRFMWHERLHTATVEKLINLFAQTKRGRP